MARLREEWGPGASVPGSDVTDMLDLGLRNLDQVIACIGEADHESRTNLADALRRAGVGQVRAYADLPSLIANSTDADLLILGDTLGDEIWPAIGALRHNQLAGNPFAIVVCYVDPDNALAAQQALAVGTDDLIVRPMHEDQFLPRLRRIISHRAPFVVSSDYLGPERRGRSRGSSIGRLNVPNAVLDKAKGRGLAEIQKSVVDTTLLALRARLDAHGYRLGFLCVTAARGNVDHDGLPVRIAHLISDGGRLALQAGAVVTWIICGSLSDLLKQATDVRTFSAQTVALCMAAVSSMRLGMTTAGATDEAERAADIFTGRPRAPFPPMEKLRGVQADGSKGEMPRATIRLAGKGEILFRQDEPAHTIHVVAAGSVALFRQRHGQEIPVANIRKGESFGDMALADGSAHRVTAIADSDAVLIEVRDKNLETQLQAADPAVRAFFDILGASVRGVHDLYTPKSRHIGDSVQHMVEQVAAIADYVSSARAPAALRAEATSIAKRLAELTAELVGVLAEHPELDRRSRVLPSADRNAGL